jgi:hypothetical protein
MIVPIIIVMLVSACVSPRLRIKRFLNRIDVAAETRNHFLDHMIGADTDAITEQLYWQMPVAEMPRNADEFTLVMCVDLQQWFRLGTNAHHQAVVQHQPVAMAQPHSLRQIEQHFTPSFGHKQDSATMPAVEIDQYAIGFPGRFPGSGRQHVLRTHQNRK